MNIKLILKLNSSNNYIGLNPNQAYIRIFCESSMSFTFISSKLITQDPKVILTIWVEFGLIKIRLKWPD